MLVGVVFLLDLHTIGQLYSLVQPTGILIETNIEIIGCCMQ